MLLIANAKGKANAHVLRNAAIVQRIWEGCSGLRAAGWLCCGRLRKPIHFLSLKADDDAPPEGMLNGEGGT